MDRPDIDFKGRDTDPMIIAKASAMLTGWWEKNAEPFADRFKVLSVESEFAFPLLNPESESPSRSFVEAGKIDATILEKASNREAVMEHKTSSEDISTGSEYWARLKMNTQISKYFLSRVQAGADLAFVLYDVLRTPAQRPSGVPVLDDDGTKIVVDIITGERLANKNGTWKQSVGDSATQKLETRPETPGEYRERILSAIREDINSFYSWAEVPRLENDLIEYMGDAWATTQELLMRRRMGIWPRNPAACLTFGRCEYFDLCTGRDSVNGVNFTTTENRHAELEMQEVGDKELLTNSRISCLRTCARKHFLRYEQKVVPTTPPSEALRLGTLVHHGLEQFLLAIKDQQR